MVADATRRREPSGLTAPVGLDPAGDLTGQDTSLRASNDIEVAVARLDRWFETIRSDEGYGGPVAHWWQQSLVYTGAALDWRYEGIIAGYLELWRRTSNPQWLDKACRAGDDLVRGQDESSHYRNSAFELNPATAGTPHEGACDVALLLLASTLRDAGCPEWTRYADCAESNLRTFYIDQLWDATTCSFRDSPVAQSFVPNKAATVCQALFLLAELRGDDRWITSYVLPTLEHVIIHQQRGAGLLDGAIAQNSFGTRRIEKYFPIYIARCVPALVNAYQWTTRSIYLDTAIRAMDFIQRWSDDDGSVPTVVYPNLTTNRCPDWIAPLGDILRAADSLRPFGHADTFSQTRQRLLNGQDSSGGIQTATRFAGQAGGKPGRHPDVRDILHVAGWCDKVFRYLAGHVTTDLPEVVITSFESDCVFRGRSLHFVETPEMVEISSGDAVSYRWRKGQAWAEVATQEFWLR